MTSNLILAITTGIVFAFDLVIIVLIATSPHLGFWWQLGLGLLFFFGMVTQLVIMVRLPTREKVLQALSALEKQDTSSTNPTNATFYSYIRKYLK